MAPSFAGRASRPRPTAGPTRRTRACRARRRRRARAARAAWGASAGGRSCPRGSTRRCRTGSPSNPTLVRIRRVGVGRRGAGIGDVAVLRRLRPSPRARRLIQGTRTRPRCRRHDAQVEGRGAEIGATIFLRRGADAYARSTISNRPSTRRAAPGTTRLSLEEAPSSLELAAVVVVVVPAVPPRARSSATVRSSGARRTAARRARVRRGTRRGRRGRSEARARPPPRPRRPRARTRRPRRRASRRARSSGARRSARRARLEERRGGGASARPRRHPRRARRRGALCVSSLTRAIAPRSRVATATRGGPSRDDRAARGRSRAHPRARLRPCRGDQRAAQREEAAISGGSAFSTLGRCYERNICKGIQLKKCRPGRAFLPPQHPPPGAAGASRALRRPSRRALRVRARTGRARRGPHAGDRSSTLPVLVARGPGTPSRVAARRHAREAARRAEAVAVAVAPALCPG